jgi:hypothetical protein
MPLNVRIGSAGPRILHVPRAAENIGAACGVRPLLGSWFLLRGWFKPNSNDPVSQELAGIMTTEFFNIRENEMTPEHKWVTISDSEL